MREHDHKTERNFNTMATDFNFTMIEFARQAESAASAAVDSLFKTWGDKRLTYDAQKEDADNTVRAAKGSLERIRENGYAAIEGKCLKLDEMESENRRARALDTEYQQRLSAKVGILAQLDSNVDGTFLRDFLAEFEGDPVACAAVKGVLHEDVKTAETGAAMGNMQRDMQLVSILRDSTGSRQAHIRDVVRRGFDDLLDAFRVSVDSACGEFSRLISAGTYAHHKGRLEYYKSGIKVRADEFCDYCTRQNPDFSRDDMEIWKEKHGTDHEKDMSKAFAFNLTPLSGSEKN